MTTMRMALAAAAALAALTAAAPAQDWPTRPITLIVPFAPGGGVDASARLQALAIGEVLGQTIVVENVGAAAGTIGSGRVAKAAPDGYTLLIGNSGTQVYSQALYKKKPYDAVADFEPVAHGDGIAAHPGRPQGPAGQQPAGADRLHEGQPGQDAVLVGRRRLRHASALRAVELHARRQHHPGALSRRKPGVAGRDRRPHRLHVHHHPERRGAGQAGHGEGHRGDGAAARARSFPISPPPASRACRASRRRCGTASSSRRARPSRSSTRCTRRSRR